MPYNRENNYTLKIINLDDDTQVNSGGGTDTRQIKPDVGYIYEVVNLSINIPDATGSTAGTHTLKAAPHGGASFSRFFNLISNTGTWIACRYNSFECDTESPSVATDQSLMIRSMTASNSVPIDLLYTNNLDANQTGTRSIEVLVKKYREAA